MADSDDPQPMSEEEEEEYLQIRPPQAQAEQVAPEPLPSPPIQVHQQDDDDFEAISDEDDNQIRTQSPQTGQVHQTAGPTPPLGPSPIVPLHTFLPAGFRRGPPPGPPPGGPIGPVSSQLPTARYQPYPTHRPTGHTSGRPGSSSRQPFAREEYNIFVRLELGNDKHYQALFETSDDGDTIDQAELKYHYSVNCDYYSVRIPAMMYYRHPSHRNDEVLRDFNIFMVRQYRHQSAQHLVGVFCAQNPSYPRYYSSPLRCERMCYGAITREGLEYLEENNPNKYGCMNSQFHPLTNVYPCYKPKGIRGKEGLKMVLGLCFSLKNNGGVRSFGRFDYPDITNEFVRDIYEDDLDLQGKTQGKPHLLDNNFYSNKSGDRTYANAFYVCQGAKLIVVDTRFIGARGYHQNEYNPDGHTHCRSLFLPGSLVVIKSPLHVGLDVIMGDQDTRNANHELTLNQFLAQHTSPREKGVFNMGMLPLDFMEKRLDKVYTTDRNGAKVSDLSHQSKVIFLGPAESQYNSACWTLNVHRSADYYHDAVLKVPEGGGIVDIAPWNTGIALVKYKHDYERLFEGVLQPIVSDREFKAPPDRDGHYFLQRLLGIVTSDCKWNSCAIDPDYDLIPGMGDDYVTGGHNGGDNDLRRYVQPFIFQEWQSESGARYLDQFIDIESAIAYRNWHYPSDEPAHHGSDHGSGTEATVKTYGKLPVPPEPLYPPIYREENNTMQFLYLGKDVKVNRYDTYDPDTPLRDLKFQIDGMDEIYEWAFVESRQGFWMMVRDPNIVHAYQTNIEGRNENFGEYCKIGIDYHYYLKQPHPDSGQNSPYMTTMKLVLKQVPEESLEEAIKARLEALQSITGSQV